MIDIRNIQELEERLQQLVNKPINSVEELEGWIQEEGQIDKEIKQQIGKCYIDFHCYSDNEEIKKAYQFSQQKATPLVKKYKAQLDEKFYNNPFKSDLNQELYGSYIKSKLNSIELFKEENIKLEAEEDALISKYSSIMGNMTVMWEGEEKTLLQMSVYLMGSDRSIREKAWRLVQERRLEDSKDLDEIMDQMVKIRHQIAINAGFSNYRDYMFKKYERFDYTPEECKTFHQAVEKTIVPIKDGLERELQQKLGVDTLRPWDSNATPQGTKAISLLETSKDMVEVTIKMFYSVKKEYGDLLRKMQEEGMLDLDSRKAKANGGFCYYLPVKELSFIFMNFSGSYHGFVTMVHEMGHSIHNLLKKNLPIYHYHTTPMESSELASMSMELITMDKWNCLYPDKEDFKKLRIDHLENIIKFVSWAMTVDKFQHWIYENPNHTAKERNMMFKEIAKSLSQHYEDWSGLQEELENRWKAQIHMYEVPFYYIEYAIAQLGALQVWKNYCENPQKALADFESALALGRSKPLTEVYEAAGIKFDFSEELIGELMDFIKGKLEAIKNQ
ncbi:M3 family oligoendopeptidase [Alkaliphilus serpentinus]|uniref:M3 family oligoendopeptidase n=1 Tax=Alkaliphilus serpentinus TaxID=1482731 RepID=A0A833HLH4_9FIRM|nr:M3 family oligoendopeptidase [Alkaliphilus serpentinus]KAB3525834.1 M3 family oligoendopeptidase [Alkaliphilus serpentinus]